MKAPPAGKTQVQCLLELSCSSARSVFHGVSHRSSTVPPPVGLAQAIGLPTRLYFSSQPTREVQETPACVSYSPVSSYRRSDSDSPAKARVASGAQAGSEFHCQCLERAPQHGSARPSCHGAL